MGFGRIGRNIFRILHERKDLQVTAISDIAPFKTIEYLLRWDTVHGPFPDKVELKQDRLYVAGSEIHLVNGAAPGDVDWKDLGADFVIEATTKYRSRKLLEQHLQMGAKRVVLTVPPQEGENIDIVVMGVNNELLSAKTRVVSNGSVTINCLAPILKLLHEAYGVRRAAMTTVHAYTNAQRLADVPHADYRSSRSAAENIIPAPTSAPQVLARVLPQLQGRLQGIAMNVPIPDGSIVDLVSEMETEVTAAQINSLIQSAAGSRQFKNIIQYVEDPIVSSDVIGNTHSAIFDGLSTRVLHGNLLKTLTWFDNGWGYACRVVELLERLAAFEVKK